MKKVLLPASVFLLLMSTSCETQEEAVSEVPQEEISKEDKIMKEAGEKFLTDNAKREGVKVTASGLQYEVVEQSEGNKPMAQDTVMVHYTGKFTDGKVFDSSEGGEPISFPLNRVISGWTEGLQLMSVGSKYRFYIPYNLAYGERGYPGAIPPYSALIFDVQLLEIK